MQLTFLLRILLRSVLFSPIRSRYWQEIIGPSEEIKFIDIEVLERIGEKRALLNNILSIKTNWIGHT